jgi:hypothetical protein
MHPTNLMIFISPPAISPREPNVRTTIFAKDGYVRVTFHITPRGHTLHKGYVSVYISACSNQKNSSPVQTSALFALYVDVLDRQMCVVWRARATMLFVSRKMSNNENKVNSRPWVHADGSSATHQARGTRRAVALHKPRPGANRH